MSAATRAPRGSGALGPGLRAVIAAGLVGLLAGFLWGVADVPRYTAAAAVVVSPRGDGEIDSAELDRYASLGKSSKVAAKAAAILGGDVPGGDLLSEVSVVPSTASGGLLVRASADAPDIAAATADGYAQALVAVGGKRLEAGAAATLPEAPSENRSALLWSALGLLAGLLLGAAGVAAISRLAAGSARREPDGVADVPPATAERDLAPAGAHVAEPEPEEQPPAVEDAFGVPMIAGPLDPRGPAQRAEGALWLDPAAAGAIDELIEELGIDDEDGPRTIAVLEAGAGEGADAVMIGLAIAAGELGLRAIAVEADLADPTLAQAAGVAASPGLRDYLDGGAGPRDVLRSARVGGGAGATPLVCVPAGTSGPDPSSALGGPRFAALLDRLSRVYDVVLLSGPPASEGRDAAALADRVDGVVLVAADSPGAPERIAAAVEEISRENLIAGVLTRPEPSQARPQGVHPPP